MDTDKHGWGRETRIARIFTKAENRLNNQGIKEPSGDEEEELNRRKRRDRRIGTQNDGNVLRDAGIDKESRKVGRQEQAEPAPTATDGEERHEWHELSRKRKMG
jgi:hypothetical protein